MVSGDSLQNKAYFNQNKGHLGSRGVYIYLYFPGSLILRSQFLQVVLLNLLEEIAHLKELSVGMLQKRPCRCIK